jgi:hypothetical protein
MMTTPLTYAAELEQALTIVEVLDRMSRPEAPWGDTALDAACERFGATGANLPFEYQNDVFEIENGRPAAFVLFH